TFAATTLLAKCPSKYEAQNRSPSDYKAPVTEDRPSSATPETAPAVR
ncbi:MAG: hypothetical protein HY510_02070, partial [Acidobacteria bacterium]|nr:hypothetical protein [Acidobacteriota bacterium]